MSTTAALPVSVIDDAVVRTMEHVFSTMIRHHIRLTAKLDSGTVAIPSPEPQVIACVGFLGSANGVIYLRIPEAYAKLATGCILGMTPNEVEMNGPEVIQDAMGEITNMAVGGFKNTIADLGYPCKLTLPTIIRGHDVTIASIKAATRHIFHFECEQHMIVADLQVKVE